MFIAKKNNSCVNGDIASNIWRHNVDLCLVVYNCQIVSRKKCIFLYMNVNTVQWHPQKPPDGVKKETSSWKS